MNEEQTIALAEQMTKGLIEVTRTEWMHWVQIAQTSGLEQALQWAERMAKDVTLRPAVKRANYLIAKTIRAHFHKVKSLSLAEQSLLFGYVARLLTVETLRGSLGSSNRRNKQNIKSRR